MEENSNKHTWPNFNETPAEMILGIIRQVLGNFDAAGSELWVKVLLVSTVLLLTFWRELRVNGIFCTYRFLSLKSELDFKQISYFRKMKQVRCCFLGIFHPLEPDVH